MKNRQELAKYFNELGFKTGAEVGVFKGCYSEELCKNNPSLKLYCIDPWVGVSHKKAFSVAQQRLAPYNAILVKKYSMDAVKDFADGFFDFVYIDAAHDYESVRDDIREWTKKVRLNGIVAGHDYMELKRKDITLGIIKAVNEYVADYNYKLMLTGGGENPNDHDSYAPSWYFVKS
jgi:predicted O-methyltransferase YrrM